MKTLQQVREDALLVLHPVRLPAAHMQEPTASPAGHQAASMATAPPLRLLVSPQLLDPGTGKLGTPPLCSLLCRLQEGSKHPVHRP